MKSSICLIFSIFLLSFAATAEDKCLYSLEEDLSKAKTTWTAYKTPKKVGVNGSFTTISYTAQEAENLNLFLKSAKVEIDTESVNSGLKERDDKLLKFFFKLMKNSKIKAHVENIKDDTALVIISMNNVKKEVPMKYTFDKNLLTLTGDIDILNWSLDKALASINKACFVLHEKKTWSDVGLKIEVPVKYECHGKL
jgi:polyisoprenoid-binding protein YceI